MYDGNRPRPVARQLLRRDVSSHLRELVLEGTLPPGESIGENLVASQLGVSRTPLREALLQLEHDGIVDAHPGRGFVVRPLAAREVDEVYPLVWVLERVALESADLPDSARLAELRRLNEQFRAESDPRRRVELDLEWHRLLRSGCQNRRLQAFVASLKHVIHRYEVHYMADAGRVSRSVREHRQIIAALGARDRRRAAEALEAHWRGGRDAVLAAVAADPELAR